MPGGAGSELLAFQQDDVGGTELRKVIRDGRTDDAPTDNDVLRREGRSVELATMATCARQD